MFGSFWFASLPQSFSCFRPLATRLEIFNWYPNILFASFDDYERGPFVIIFFRVENERLL